ncbi:MAG: hypothetical protein J0I41_17575 [Filimonas sp.]|nr:hypothetical protein [Filimonas sp.]
MHPYRWYLLFVAGVAMLMAYADYTGWRVLTFNQQQHWSASGPSGHK